MARIFISYGREDRDHASKLADGLTALHHEVWWDRALLAGDSFREVIEEEIERAEVMIVLWSAISVKKQFVIDEASRAAAEKKLIPASFAPQVDFKLPLGLGQGNYVNLSDWDGDPKALAELERGITAIQQGVWADMLAALAGKVSGGAMGENRIFRDLVRGGSNIGGLSMTRFVGGVLAATATAAVLQGAVSGLTEDPQAGFNSMWVAANVLVLMAVARLCAQFIAAVRGRASVAFYDNAFSFWVILSLLVGVMWFALCIISADAAESLVRALNVAVRFLATLYFIRAAISLTRILVRRL